MNEFLRIEAELTTTYNQLKKKKNQLSNIRLGAFIFTAILGYLYSTEDLMVYLVGAIIAFIAFMTMVVRSNKTSSELAYTVDALSIIEDIKLDDRLDEFENLPPEWFDNVYNKDLDILQGNSIFNRVNKTQSLVGNAQLKHFLSNGLTDKQEILKRQATFQELGKKPEWMVKFLTLAKRVGINQGVIFGEMNHAFASYNLRFLPLVWGTLNALTFLYLGWNGFPKKAVFFWVVSAVPIGFLINWIFRNKINQALSHLFINANQLENLLGLLKHIEAESFATELTQTSQKAFTNNGKKASETLKAVQSTIEGLEASGFPIIGFILNQFALWKFYHAIQFEHRMADVVKYNAQWINQIAHLEAYQSFAIFNRKFDNFTLPEISDQPFELALMEAYHPLLSEEIAVKNSCSTNRPNNITIITGANMAGKSTFLRTVGTNLVLAMNGANVSAKHMKFFPMQLFTSIKTVDNLSSGDSYFKNEINKLKILIDQLDQGIPQYIILDEILKGTNSQDKLIGSKKFLEKLMRHPTALVCFIATHDLELTKMEEEYPNHVINYCFELKNVDSNYFSDYKLRKGTTQVMNAIFLMKEFKIIDE